MFRKLSLSAALVGILGTAFALAPASAPDRLATSPTDAVPVTNPMLSHSAAFSTRG